MKYGFILVAAACCCVLGLALHNKATPATQAWNSADACSLLPDATVASATGSAVTAHKLVGVFEGAGMATHSTCLYTLANGGQVSLLARKSPIPDTSKSAIEMARTAGGLMPAAKDVGGLGRAGLWTAEANTLQVFIDDTRYVTLTGRSLSADPKTALITMARTTML